MQVEGMSKFKVLSGVDLLGIHLGMDEDELATV